ncbi:hypothetical protein [Streptomyces sp. NPDC087787]|uniref:hypothetical protein n=1 Tax=Streptomyces sp. NPDC087787 TaxID=3365803 RepID=UPI0037FB3108
MNDELAERRAATRSYDRWGVPRAFISILDSTGGVTYESSRKVANLPLSLAPAAVKKAVSAANKAQDKLEAADDKAAELFAEYQAVPAQAQREINAAVERGEVSPSLSALVDERQEKLAGPLRDAIGLRNALSAAAGKAGNAADKARERYRDDWRDAVAAHVAAEMPKVRKGLEDAASATAAALNAANAIAALQQECAIVDAQWLSEREAASEIRISPYQTQIDYARATPDVYEQDRKTVMQARENRLGSVLGNPVNVVAEIEKRVGWLGSYSDGGHFPDSLFVPLSSHEPVTRNWDDDE